MNGDPNTVRDDILGALALIEATIEGMPDTPDKLSLAFASSALRRANEKLRGTKDGELGDLIEFPPAGHSVKVRDEFAWRVDGGAA